mmetsp:Transcript_16698/g.39046  ORF Transcript_16698/g.39046 Transcript_16698/m.39046 type:complete len:206 (+) Transcript_16698:81-698(+)
MAILHSFRVHVALALVSSLLSLQSGSAFNQLPEMLDEMLHDFDESEDVSQQLDPVKAEVAWLDTALSDPPATSGRLCTGHCGSTAEAAAQEASLHAAEQGQQLDLLLLPADTKERAVDIADFGKADSQKAQAGVAKVMQGVLFAAALASFARTLFRSMKASHQEFKTAQSTAMVDAAQKERQKDLRQVRAISIARKAQAVKVIGS